ncbi:hypothetical protein GDO86_019412, partial [Hymenochirus boettgeri]
VHLLSLFFTGLTKEVKVTQDKKFLVVNQGDPARFQCRHNGESYYAMLWYQQAPGQGLKLMVFSATKSNKMEDGFEHCLLERPDALSSILKINNVETLHSALYFCSVSEHS